MSNSLKILIGCWLLVVACSSGFAQNPAAGQSGKLKDTVVVDVVKAFQPTIANAIKINENPVINDTTKKTPLLSYSIQSKKVNTSFDVDPIKPAKMLGEPLTKLYNTLIKAGFGNYTTPYGELFYNNLRSKDYSFGTHLKHLSSTATLKDYGFSGYSDNEASVYGKKFLNKQTLYGDINYSRNVVHYYGYNISEFSPEKDSIKQRFSFINPKLQLISYFKDSSRINHDIKLSYYNLADSYKATENNVLADATLKFHTGIGPITFKSTVDYYHNRNLNDTTNNTLIKLNPSWTERGDKWETSLGTAVVGNISSTNAFYFYPYIDFNYHIINNILIPYAGVSGGLTRNSFKLLSDNNPFLVSDVLIRNSDNKYNLYAGIRGTLEASTSFNLKGSYSQINNAAFFVNDVSELMKNRFDVVYDNIRLLNIHGELAYQKNEKLRLLAKGDYYKYDMQKEMAAWYKPQMQLTFSGNYNLRDKIVVKTDVFVLSKQYAKIFTTTTSGSITTTTESKKELKGIADINLGFEYRHTKKLSGFVNFNNIGAFRYYRWNNYPAQRFNFLAGVSYSF